MQHFLNPKNTYTKMATLAEDKGNLPFAHETALALDQCHWVSIPSFIGAVLSKPFLFFYFLNLSCFLYCKKNQLAFNFAHWTDFLRGLWGWCFFFLKGLWGCRLGEWTGGHWGARRLCGRGGPWLGLWGWLGRWPHFTPQHGRRPSPRG